MFKRHLNLGLIVLILALCPIGILAGSGESSEASVNPSSGWGNGVLEGDDEAELAGNENIAEEMKKYISPPEVLGMMDRVQGQPQEEELVRTIFYSWEEIDQYKREFEQIPEKMSNSWRDYFNLLGVGADEEMKDTIKVRLPDWPSFSTYLSFLVEGEGTPGFMTEMEEWVDNSGEDYEFEPPKGELYLFGQKGSNPFSQDIDLQLRRITPPAVTRLKSFFTVENVAEKVTGKKPSPQTIEKGKKVFGWAKKLFKDQIMENEYVKQGQELVNQGRDMLENTGLDDYAPKADKYPEDTEVRAVYVKTTEDDIIYKWYKEKEELNIKIEGTPASDLDTSLENHMNLDRVGENLEQAQNLKDRLINLERNQRFKEKPIYFAENSTHASSAKSMNEIRTIMIANFDLVYGFKRPVPRNRWPDLLKTLPPLYLDFCSAGLGGINQFFAGKSPFKQWLWLADAENNQYSLGFFPVIRFKNQLLAAGKTLVKYKVAEEDIGVAVAAKPYLDVNLGDIEEIYYPVNIHINEDRRDYLRWVERNPNRTQPFKIILGPSQLHNLDLTKRKGRKQILKSEVYKIVGEYEQQHNLKVDAILNIRYVARGVRNMCKMELIHLEQSKGMEQEVSGFHFSFGAAALLKKERELKHQVVLDNQKMPKMRGDLLDRVITSVTGAREGHSDTLHIDPKVMFEYGLDYLANDIKTIRSKVGDVRNP